MAPNYQKCRFSIVLSLCMMLFLRSCESDTPTPINQILPFSCSAKINNCTSCLYQHNDLTKEKISYYYSVNTSQIKPITYGNGNNFLVEVPCSCQTVNDTVGYFYDTLYAVQSDDTFPNVSDNIFSGQAWEVGGEEAKFNKGTNVTIYLPCGCQKSDSIIVVTYTVQASDTLSEIADVLSSDVDSILNYNQYLKPHPSYLETGWLIYVPMQKNGARKKKDHRKREWIIALSILSAVTLLSICAVVIFILRRKKFKQNKLKNGSAKSMIINRSLSGKMHFTNPENFEDFTAIESEKPMVYSLEEVAEATEDFDERRKIGQGGYGSVYRGTMRKQEIAVKKMRSNKSKEFLAELKVLCKIHHINVVELLGYASGDDHLYLVYEYVQNGSLNDHLHDPLLRGHQPLTWTARTQIALDAARGIEYIHDHTKSRYVHRDIKTSNILLDETLRAKVADFGLAKLVNRTNEDELMATRLVGTPGYLPPESVKELQVTTKTDVFAFGVVLAELITGKRAINRDHREPTRMKSLITIINNIFEDEDSEQALESEIDGNLKGGYPMEDVFKMAEISRWCLSEEAINRPEMREVVVALSKIRVSSIEWEASLGGNSQVFSGVFNGR